MAEVPRFNQPPPDKPLLGQPVIMAEQVMPHAKEDPHEPLPPAAPLPAKASEPASGAGATNKEDAGGVNRSEEHTYELQSQSNLVCRLLLEKKNAFGTPVADPY